MAAGIKDDDLRELVGAELRASAAPHARYVLKRVVGEGAHGVVFLAAHTDSEGKEGLAVIKLLRPRAVRELSALAGAAWAKEVTALMRLTGGSSPVPHVVRYLDSGTLRLGDNPLELPWLACEHVDGGTEGVTLRARVERSILRSGAAFDPQRAALALRSICGAAEAIHECGVVHRDIGPNNVLCTGSGPRETFKLADFGLARVTAAVTFGNVLLGTPGYCAPEQSFPDKFGVGPYTDVFAIACTVFFLLTGEPFFVAPTVAETLVEVYAPERRKLLESKHLHGLLQMDRKACLALDEVLSKSTQADPSRRPQSAAELGASLLQVLMP